MTQLDTTPSGTDQQPSRRPPRPRLGWVIAAVAGLALGYLLGIGSGQLTTSANLRNVDELPVLSQTASPTTAPTGPILSERVPGLRQPLVAILGSPVDVMQLSVWDPESPEPALLPVTVPRQSTSISLDVSGRYAAWLTLGPEAPSLFAGPVGRVSPHRFGVTSIAWHDATAGQLAFIQSGQLWTTTIIPGGQSTSVLITDVASEGDVALVAYGDWGFALQELRPRPQLVVLDIDGQRVMTVLGQYQELAVRGDGRVLLRELLAKSDGTPTWRFAALDAREAPRLDVLDWMVPGSGLEIPSVLAADWQSGEDERLILLTARPDGTGVQVEVRSAGGDRLEAMTLPVAFADEAVQTFRQRSTVPLSLDGSGRFVSITAGRTVIMIDLDDGSVQPVTYADRVYLAAVR